MAAEVILKSVAMVIAQVHYQGNASVNGSGSSFRMWGTGRSHVYTGLNYLGDKPLLRMFKKNQVWLFQASLLLQAFDEFLLRWDTE